MAQTVYHAPAPEQAQGTPPKKGKKKKWLILLLALLLLALLAAGGFFVWQYFNRGELMEPNATIGVMPGKTDQEIIDELNRKVDERSIALTINPAPVAEDGGSPVNWMYENPQSNDKYTKLEVYLDDTEELIYETALMINGSYIESAPPEGGAARGHLQLHRLCSRLPPGGQELPGAGGRRADFDH